MSPILERFESKYIPEPNSGCWLWIGAANQKGYGQFRMDATTRSAHRISYLLHVGSIPDGLQLDHKCRVHCCVNPAHLEPVTPKENTRRGDLWKVHGLKTHCRAGHPYSGDNLVTMPGRRRCRICLTKANRDFTARRRAAREAF